MSTARIIHTWADGSTVECEVDDDCDAHPDLLDELVKRVLAMYSAVVMPEAD